MLALLISEFRDNRLAQAIFKPVAALGFLLLAVKVGALETDYGRLIFTGLLACAIGDIFLLSRNNSSLFKLGVLAFAVGHVFYIMAANLISDPNLPFIFWLGSFLLGVFVTAGVFKYFKKRVPKDMIWPLAGYIFVISLMCVYAVQSDRVGAHILIIPAAFFFAVSDLFVARDRFLKPTHCNAVFITPLYFGAQALFAYSTFV